MRWWLSAMDRFTATMKTIASFIAIILVVFWFLNVILRYVFSEPFVFTEEITGYLYHLLFSWV